MIPSAIKSRLNAAPFRPFTLRLGSGESHAVRDPELVSLSPGGRHLILWIDDNEYMDIDVLLVEAIGNSHGNGDSRRKSA